MDPNDRPPSFMGAAIIDVDIDGSGFNSDLPTWLRDVLDRALNSDGSRSRKRVASEAAIESLKTVDLSALTDKTCPICFDEYDAPTKKESSEMDKDPNKIKKEETINENKVLTDRLRKQYKLSQESLEEGSRFNDPSLFMPIDEGAISHTRFPMRNLSILENPGVNLTVPGYKEAKRKSRSDERTLDDYAVEHTPVQIPSCGHTFGKSCIVEWLRNNVSCPLCRKEVEALTEPESSTERRSELRRNIFCNYNLNPQEMMDFIANHLTDVFHPYRRPFNLSITPLTDSYMHQEWATPYDSLASEFVSSGRPRDPELVLPRRFPFSGGQSLFPFFSGRRNREMRRERNRPANEDTDATNRPEPTQEQHGASNAQNSTNNTFSGDTSNTQLINRPANPAVPSGIPGGGGPERSTRSRSNLGRSHPYAMPPP